MMSPAPTGSGALYGRAFRNAEPAAALPLAVKPDARSAAIIGFAMVAILGILPLGMNAQRDNRQDDRPGNLKELHIGLDQHHRRLALGLFRFGVIAAALALLAPVSASATTRSARWSAGAWPSGRQCIWRPSSPTSSRTAWCNPS